MSVASFEAVLRQIDDTIPFEPGYDNESSLNWRVSTRMRRRGAESHDEDDPLDNRRRPFRRS